MCPLGIIYLCFRMRKINILGYIKVYDNNQVKENSSDTTDYTTYAVKIKSSKQRRESGFGCYNLQG